MKNIDEELNCFRFPKLPIANDRDLHMGNHTKCVKKFCVECWTLKEIAIYENQFK